MTERQATATSIGLLVKCDNNSFLQWKCISVTSSVAKQYKCN